MEFILIIIGAAGIAGLIFMGLSIKKKTLAKKQRNLMLKKVKTKSEETNHIGVKPTSSLGHFRPAPPPIYTRDSQRPASAKTDSDSSYDFITGAVTGYALNSILNSATSDSSGSHEWMTVGNFEGNSSSDNFLTTSSSESSWSSSSSDSSWSSSS